MNEKDGIDLKFRGENLTEIKIHRGLLKYKGNVFIQCKTICKIFVVLLSCNDLLRRLPQDNAAMQQPKFCAPSLPIIQGYINLCW